ncbi:MAG: hypothetical protein LBU60_03645 [Clostridiales bacterium]|jgi:hypothetical protein|nr:hypothetical protein [Clostridiales bacterium]
MDCLHREIMKEIVASNPNGGIVSCYSNTEIISNADLLFIHNFNEKTS